MRFFAGNATSSPRVLQRLGVGRAEVDILIALSAVANCWIGGGREAFPGSWTGNLHANATVSNGALSTHFLQPGQRASNPRSEATSGSVACWPALSVCARGVTDGAKCKRPRHSGEPRQLAPAPSIHAPNSHRNCSQRSRPRARAERAARRGPRRFGELTPDRPRAHDAGPSCQRTDRRPLPRPSAPRTLVAASSTTPDREPAYRSARRGQRWRPPARTVPDAALAPARSPGLTWLSFVI